MCIVWKGHNGLLASNMNVYCVASLLLLPPPSTSSFSLLLLPPPSTFSFYLLFLPPPSTSSFYPKVGKGGLSQESQFVQGVVEEINKRKGRFEDKDDNEEEEDKRPPPPPSPRVQRRKRSGNIEQCTKDILQRYVSSWECSMNPPDHLVTMNPFTAVFLIHFYDMHD
jgi:hypothetical protein